MMKAVHYASLPAAYAARLHGYLICAWLQVVTDVMEPWQEGE